ncbi:putative transporter [Hoylesella saccharolytica]|uniref:putative transporter n=1 Tax=Hoylesella saccharolytica TaxID=633701 RepID=UPI0028EE5726|nr:putative transporter [Hoylesella saccharolytica]
MEWINGLFTVHSAFQAVVVLSLICFMGLVLGKIHIKGISLGVAFVFFIGIIAGHLGLEVDPQMLNYAETFGLVLFVYTLGLHVGPNFFGSLRREGISLNLWSMAVILLGTVLALVLCQVTNIPLQTMVGLFCGATTNTPALGAAQQALENFGLSTRSAALGCAVTYPLGVVGVIFAMIFLRKLFVKPFHLHMRSTQEEDHTYVVQFEVVNQAIGGKTIAEISQMAHIRFIISRIWRGEQVIVPLSSTQLQVGDNVLVVTTDNEVAGMELLFGKRINKDWNKDQIDWNHIDSKVESKVVVITRPMLNGKKLGSLQLRNTYGVNVSRVTRGDTKLLGTNDLRLQYGDRVTVVGEHDALENVEHYLGNAVQTLNEPNLGAIFLGMILGLAIGTIPITLPGMSAPVKMGIAGGPIVMGILVGSIGPRFRLISYTTRSASLMLRQLGLALYLACLGLDAGKDFFSTVIRPEGLLWVGIGFVLTVVPVLIVGYIALRTKKIDFGSICGILCGSMANPMALTYANDTLEGDAPAVTYATVYPLGMFLRVIIVQIMVMFFAAP